MIYCFRCPSCGRVYEKKNRDFVGVCENTHFIVGPNAEDTTLRRDYRTEAALIDKFSLRQDVRGTRRHRTDPLPPEEAHRVNQERKS